LRIDEHANVKDVLDMLKIPKRTLKSSASGKSV